MHDDSSAKRPLSRRKPARARSRLETPGAPPRRRKAKARKRGRATWFTASLAAAVFGVLLTGSFDRLSLHKAPEVGLQAAKADIGPVWVIDVNQDGAADFANPTQSEIRAEDCYGSGSFGAERDGGKREHAGADYVAAPGAPVNAPISGVVTRLGYAYAKNSTLRYVELSNERTQVAARVLYVDPTVQVGDEILAGQAIGVAQDLSRRYPQITNHVHVEIDVNGVALDPALVLPNGEPAYAALVSARAG